MALLNALTAFRMEKAVPLSFFPPVSLLIPLRNEALRVSSLVNQVKKLSYPNLEVIFLSDESTDETVFLLRAQAREDFIVKEGLPLPPGWVGKSWACEQLSQFASGEYLLFCDADVLMSADSVEKTISWMGAQSADALTALPFQEMKTVAEQSIIPFVMHLPILGLVPLRWVAGFKNPKWAVANGQWFCFHREAYKKVGGHESVKNSLLEDMDLARRLMREGKSILPVLATSDLRVRMYFSWNELKEGFTKNLFFLAGGTLRGTFFVLSLSFLLYAFPFVAAFLNQEGAAFLLGGLLLFRGIACVVFRSSSETVWLHPVGYLAFSGLCLKSLWSYWTRSFVWRGRQVSCPPN